MPTSSPQAPFESEFVSFRGLDVRIARTHRPGAQTVILTSPMPESVYAFTPIWPTLAAEHSLLAIDLPGFGRSTSTPDVLAPEPMGELVLGLAEHLGVDRAHGIGPDIGTSALLSAAAREPGFFTSLTVGSGGASYPLRLGSLLEDFVEADSAEAFRGLDMREVVESLFESSDYSPSAFVTEDYVDSYPPDRFVACLDYVRSYPTTLPGLLAALGGVTTPVHVVAGRDDPFVPLVNAEDLHSALPHSKLTVLDTGHLPWEEAHRDYGALALEWISGGHRLV